MKAGDGNSSLVGGKGNDTLIGGVGKDIFFYANGDGHDIIQNYESGSDVIHITAGTLKSKKLSGADVVLSIGNGSMKLKNAAGKKITLMDSKGKKSTVKIGIASLPQLSSCPLVLGALHCRTLEVSHRSRLSIQQERKQRIR